MTKKYMAICVLILLVTGCLQKSQIEDINQYQDPLFCRHNSDCKEFLVDWPCGVKIANKYTEIKEDKCIEPCPRGASQEFCEWNYKIAICENNVCVAKIDCDKMKNVLETLDTSCDTIEEEYYIPNVTYNRNLLYWTAFCELFEQCEINL